MKKLLNKIKRFFQPTQYFIVTLRSVPRRETILGQKMLAEGMDEWNRAQFEMFGDQAKTYTEETWNKFLDEDEICEPRVIGFFYKRKTAEKAVMNNWGLWSESNYYRYALIYRVKGDGLYNYDSDPQWYKAWSTRSSTDCIPCIEEFHCEKCENLTPNIIYIW